jgi:hypothetical protein
MPLPLLLSFCGELGLRAISGYIYVLESERVRRALPIASEGMADVTSGGQGGGGSGG